MTDSKAQCERHTLTFDLIGVSSIVPDTQVEIQVDFVRLPNSKILLQFPLFNFSTVSNGQTLVISTNSRLPEHLRPCKNQVFSCSTNDAYLQPIVNLALGVAFPPAITSFVVQLSQRGIVRILNQQGTFITQGAHTFNSQAIIYKAKECSEVIKEKVHQRVHQTQCPPKTVKPKTSTIASTFSVLDANQYVIPGLDFTENIIVKDHTQSQIVQVIIPSFTFTIVATISPTGGFTTPSLIPGGQIQSTQGFLPSGQCPAAIQTKVLTQLSLNVSIDTFGSIRLASSTDISGIIKPGVYTLPQTVMYYESKHKKNTIFGRPPSSNLLNTKELSTGFTNVSTFQNIFAELAFNFEHTNDVFQGYFITAWNDDSALPPTSIDQLYTYARAGQVDEKGLVQLKPVHNLSTSLTQPGNFFNTSCAINRTDPQNMIVANSFNLRFINVSVSLDAGATFGAPVPITLPVGVVFTGPRGVISDRFGNFWYVGVAGSIGIYLYTSSDKGFTWKLLIGIPQINTSFTTLAQLATGIDGQGNYGLYIISDDVDHTTKNDVPVVYFIITTGLGVFGPNFMSFSFNEPNVAAYSGIAVSKKGDTLIQTSPAQLIGQNFYVESFFIKKAGTLDSLLLEGPKTVINAAQGIYPTNSQPLFNNNYLIASEFNIVDDPKLDAIYCIFQERPQNNSQDYYLFFVVSVDKGTTWSRRYDIAGSHKNNRGYASGRLDNKTGDMIVSYYDSRNSVNSVEEEYLLTVISSRYLKSIVKSLKLCLFNTVHFN